MVRLTKAQLAIVRLMQETGGDLVNFDEVSPQWWVERGPGVHNGAARALAKTDAVQYYRHEGGHPGVLYFRLTITGLYAGRQALEAHHEQ